jgi:hypothetical protein
MVKHGVQKKRRSGLKVTRKALPKHRKVKIANSVRNHHVQQLYDRNKSPKENLQSMGLVADVNNLKGSSDSILPLSEHAAFLGFSKKIEDDSNNIMHIDTNLRRKIISEFDQVYAKTNIDKHGDNYVAMERDIVMNSRQLSAKQMEKLCSKYSLHLQSLSA